MKGKTAPYPLQWNIGRLQQGRNCASNGTIVFSELHDPVSYRLFLLGSILRWLRQIAFSRARRGRFLHSPSLVTTSTAGLLCFLRISPSRNRSVSSARRWMEAFRLSINWELIAG